ncbi:hydroxylysine kinase-like [Mizuhopecten yessoensis]|uniref:Hydroxylysine kinase n=1 Tax=Mizuhopecten yessoensis TaxID=6573 RepID=A0A210R6W0_MIZYE|nr:hydroxylysine kinase-like [Mizuhopecten yessoensis]XP_021346005.1 hydroxylysine kinase-like [Mizuhopecten yessoensis]XP_021346014.1 hydroxylysine kinase-like [Mizuhopecten yessoensis]XP_021346023.1 hydroxylysine kinase-like [Mizuhopecten yessoensis]OWF56601.1 Hydroxylysine kinase [Mizuhopecten yessoensis]
MDNNNEATKPKVVLQEKGEVIKPMIPEGVVEELVRKIYGLDVVSYKELNSYDDKNYHVTVTDRSSNPHIPEVWTHGYILKILNSMDSKRPVIVEAQNSLLSHLRERNMSVPETVLTISGELMSLEKVFAEKDPKDPDTAPYGTYIVRLLKFIPGDILFNKPCTPGLLYNVGKFMGKFLNATKGFHHSFYDTHSLLWSLLEFSKLKEFVFVVKDENDKRVVDEIISAFESDVLPRCDQLQKGVIHGDLNEQNILVVEVPGQDDVTPESRVYDVSGLLDFMDVTDSYCVFDVAINIAYMSFTCEPSEQLDAGGHILAGMVPVFPFNDVELDALQISVCARLCQSLVLGAYANYQDPSNSYVLTTAAKGWPLLHKLWNTPKQVLKDRWQHIMDQYKNPS